MSENKKGEVVYFNCLHKEKTYLLRRRVKVRNNYCAKWERAERERRREGINFELRKASLVWHWCKDDCCQFSSQRISKYRNLMQSCKCIFDFSPDSNPIFTPLSISPLTVPTTQSHHCHTCTHPLLHFLQHLFMYSLLWLTALPPFMSPLCTQPKNMWGASVNQTHCSRC